MISVQSSSKVARKPGRRASRGQMFGVVYSGKLAEGEAGADCRVGSW